VCQSAWDGVKYEEEGDSQVFGVVCADVAETHILAADGNLEGLAAALEETRTTCPTFDYMTNEELDVVRLTLPGSPTMCTTPWWHWGIAVILIGVILIAVLLGVLAPKMKEGCERCLLECKRKGQERARRRQEQLQQRQRERQLERQPLEAQPIEGPGLEMRPFNTGDSEGEGGPVAVPYAVPAPTHGVANGEPSKYA